MISILNYTCFLLSKCAEFCCCWPACVILRSRYSVSPAEHAPLLWVSFAACKPLAETSTEPVKLTLTDESASEGKEWMRNLHAAHANCMEPPLCSVSRVGAHPEHACRLIFPSATNTS